LERDEPMPELLDLPDELLVKLVSFMNLVLQLQVLMDLGIEIALEPLLLGHFDV
jgi:hypothetical protein